MRTIAGTTWPVEDARAYIMARVKVDENGCWIWQWARNTFGYGRAHVPKAHGPRKRSHRAAHRLSYESFRSEVPNESLVCHSCDVPACCNPDHLWLGTPADNSADMVSKCRQATGARTRPECRARGARNGAHTKPHRRASGDRNGMRTVPDSVPRGERNGNSKLAPESALAIYQSDRSLSAIAAEFGVSKSTAARIRSGKLWAHATGHVPGTRPQR